MAFSCLSAAASPATSDVAHGTTKGKAVAALLEFSGAIWELSTLSRG